MSVQDVSVRQERIEQLRRRIAAVPGKSESVARRMPGEADREVLPVPQPLGRLLPGGGLTRGAVVTYSGSGALLLGLLAAVTGSGAHAVVVGLPRLGLLAAAEMGARLDRIAVVPDPGPDPVEVAAVLLDGLDMVILGLSGATVAPTRTRALVARARSKGCTVVVTGGRWNGAELTLEAKVADYDGLGAGTGRVRSLSVDVRATGRGGLARSARLDLRPGERGMAWTPAAGAPETVLPEQLPLAQLPLAQ